jgi:ribosome-associated translation inhibitor RaiA
MQSLMVTFRGVERSGAVETRIREIGERLRRCHDRITHCHVSVVGGLDESGDTVAAKIHVSVPGAQIHAESINPRDVGNTDVFRALRGAFDNARRQLRDLQRDARTSRLAGASAGVAGRRSGPVR